MSSVITEEIDTLEKDLLAESEISKCSDVVANCSEKQLANIERQQINVLGY